MSRKQKYFKPRQVRVPDQTIQQPLSITFDHFTFDPATGKRTKFLSRKEVKFDKSDDLADYYEANCHHDKLTDFYPPKEKV